MAIPTPSFIKIRFVFFVILFLFGCFFIGFIKNVFAGDTWETSGERWAERSYIGYGTERRTLCNEISSIDIESRSVGIDTIECVGGYWAAGDRYSYVGTGYINWYYCDDNGKRILLGTSNVEGLSSPAEGKWPILESNVGRTCQPPCPDGSRRDDITGECPAPCQNEKQEAEQTCVAPDYAGWQWIDETICEYECIPVPDQCDVFLAKCDHVCAEKGGIGLSLCGEGFEPYCGCYDGTEGDVDFIPYEIEQPEGPNENDSEDEEPPETGEGEPDTSGDDIPDETVSENPNPNPNDPSNEQLRAIKENTDTLIKQGNSQSEQLADLQITAKWNGKNQKITADNTAKIVKNTQNIKDNAGVIANNTKIIAKDQRQHIKVSQSINNKLKGIQGDISSISDGTYTGDTSSFEKPYTTSEFDFGVRTNEFLNQMKSTAIFSIPNELSASIPGGGSSIYLIDGGDTYGGVHQIDFSFASSGLIGLRAVIHIIAMFLSIKIITLKR